MIKIATERFDKNSKGRATLKAVDEIQRSKAITLRNKLNIKKAKVMHLIGAFTQMKLLQFIFQYIENVHFKQRALWMCDVDHHKRSGTTNYDIREKCYSKILGIG
jgi:hypothetical protein